MRAELFIANHFDAFWALVLFRFATMLKARVLS